MLRYLLIFMLLWSTGSTPLGAQSVQWSKTDAEALLSLVEAIKEEGLDPADYDPAQLRSALASGNDATLNSTATAIFMHLASDLSEGLGEEQVDRANLLRVLRSYLDANKLEADWAAIQRASSEFLINALCVMSPYGPEEKQALLEAQDLKRRADVLVALAEMELASSGNSGNTLQ